MDVVLQDRPGLKEIIGVLAICALLLAGLAKMDNEAAREYQSRAIRALAAQQAAEHTRAPARKAARPVAKVEARTESLGGRGPIAIPVGAAWTAGTSVAVARTHAAPASTPAPVPKPALRRIVGPVSPGPLSERTVSAKPVTTATPAPPQRRAVSVPAPTGFAPPEPPTAAIPMLLMVIAGLLIAASGAVMLTRRSE